MSVPPESNDPPKRLHSILKIGGHHPSLDDIRKAVQVVPPPKTEHDEATEKPSSAPKLQPPFWRNITILLFVAVAIRFIFVLVVIGFWFIPTAVRETGSKFPPSMKFFYPSKPHKSIDPFEGYIRDSRTTYFQVIMYIITGAYALGLFMPLVLLHNIFYVQRKSISDSVKRCWFYIIFQSIILALYLIGAINFFISADFLFAYWIDFVTIPSIIFLLVLRIKLYNSLIKNGITSTKDLYSVDPAGSSEPHKDKEDGIKNDPDFQTLFGNKKDKDDHHPDSIGSSGGGGGLERDSSVADLTKKESVLVPSSSVVLGSEAGNPGRGNTSMNTESHHLIEKHFTTTTIIKTEHGHHHDKHHANKTHDKHNKKKHVKKHSN